MLWFSEPGLLQLAVLGIILNASLCVSLLPCNFTSTEEALQYCSQFDDLYEAIDTDLQPWKDLGGISQALMKRAAMTYTTLNKQKGLMLGFKGGKAYVIDATLEAGWLGHHANIFFTYMRVMLELEELFGASIPDVEFVLASSDRPMVLRPGIMPVTMRGLLVEHDRGGRTAAGSTQAAGESGGYDRRSHDLGGRHSNGGMTSHGNSSHGSSKNMAEGMTAPHFSTGGTGHSAPGSVDSQHGGHSVTVDHSTGAAGQQRQLQARTKREEDPSATHPLPIMRFCSSAGHYDIHVPIFHFYTKKYSQRLLSQVAVVNAKYPWDKRQPVLFGRFSNYYRHVHPAVNATRRRGANNTRICVIDNPNTMTCKVRQHLFDVAALYPGQLDIRSGPHLAMLEHARFKYLVHVDGQALSSRLEQLLPLGSLVFKEESGYTAFFHHLLKPYKHYLPFWSKTPEDALPSLEWAKAHDDEARAIGATGQAFALKYLNKRARTCYWFHLLNRFAKLLTYKPEPGAGALEKQWMHVQQYFDTVARPFENGRWYTTRIEQ